jgi:hypothetical protein
MPLALVHKILMHPDYELPPADRLVTTDMPAFPSRPVTRRIHSVEIMMFMAVWLFCGLLINQKNIDDYPQHQIEAIVDYRRFSVEGLAAWNLYGDVFDYKGQGRFYSNKNPGQAIIGSVAYAHLRAFGVTYTWDRTLTGALVVFFSSCLFTAFGAVVLFRLGRDLTDERSVVWPLAAAMIWALCTTQTVFAGVAWHDTLAATMLLTAFYLLQKLRLPYPDPRTPRTISVAAGFLLGMTLATSMSFLTMVGVFGLYFLSLRRWSLLTPLILGGLASSLLIPIYNTILFGDPFLLPAVASFNQAPPDMVDAYFYLDWDNFSAKAIAYFYQLYWYVPVLWAGIVGLLLLPSKVRREQLFILAAILLLVFHMFNIKGMGVCGYGPRYLMSIMPFCCLGIAAYAAVPQQSLRLLIGLGVFCLAFISFQINAVGAAGGALFCNYGASGYNVWVHRLTTGPLPNFPLLRVLLPLAVFWIFWAIYSQSSKRCGMSEAG